jgi:hypothetical protein
MPDERPPLTPRQEQQLAAWRKARAAHARAGRRRRRPAPPVTGIRINPGRQQ